MKIVEITGSPCSGKSHALKQVDSSQVCSINIYGNPYSKGNKQFKLQRFKFFSMGLSLIGASGIFRFLELIIKSEYRLNHVLRVMFFIALKIGRCKYLSEIDSEEVIIIDEGISHIPYNLGVSDNRIIKELIDNWRHLFENVTIIMVKTEPSIIFDRLVERGHKRLNKRNIDEFVALNLAVTDSLSETYKHESIVYYEFENEVSSKIESVVAKLRSREY